MLENAKRIYSEAFEAGLRPDPLLTVSEWSDCYRFLPQKSSAEPGRWRTSRTPFLKTIMDCLSPSSPIERIVFMKGSQLGGTECGNNWLGFIIHMAPGPLMVVQPTVELGKRWSRQRMAPMIEETPALRGLVKEPRERDSGNTILSKEFKGGVMIITGANSAVGLRSMPVRYLFLDEIDGYPHDVEGEGDPVGLAEKRAATFSRRKILLVSTPTVKGVSRIEKEFEASDQRKYFVPCPFCNHMQWLQWGGIVFERDEKGSLLPESVAYKCEGCEKLIPEHHKTSMLDAGEWRPTNPEGPANIAGFHLSSLYSPIGWKGWVAIVRDFLESKKNPIALKTWVNTTLGECWEQEGDSVDDLTLYTRREDYPEVPMGVGILTAGVDVMDDRLEVTVIGWGKGEESWVIDHAIIFGDPARPQTWEELDQYLNEPLEHESGASLRIAAVAIDSGGHHTASVYSFVRPRQIRRVYAIKGVNQPGKPIVGRPSISNEAKVHLFPVGSDTCKELLYARLRISEPGPGYCHFPMSADAEYFAQLSAEKCVTKYVKGFPVRQWIKVRARNDALDCFCYALAALAILGINSKKLEALVDRLQHPREEGDESKVAQGSGRNWVMEWQ